MQQTPTYLTEPPAQNPSRLVLLFRRGRWLLRTRHVPGGLLPLATLTESNAFQVQVESLRLANDLNEPEEPTP